MIKNKCLTLVVGLGALLASCANLPLHQSLKLENENVLPASVEEIRWYDRESKVKYTVCHDGEMLYLNLAFLDPMAAIALQKGGISIYLNSKGKKGKEQELRLPGMAVENILGPNGGRRLRKEAKARNTAFDPARMISKLPEYAIWRTRKVEQVFRWRIEKTPCSIKIKANDLHQVEYQAAIPLDLIFSNGQKKPFLIIGLECKPKGSRNTLEVSGQRATSMGNRGGGRGGMGGGRRAPSGMKGGRGSSASRQVLASTYFIDFWFKVELLEKH